MTHTFLEYHSQNTFLYKMIQFENSILVFLEKRGNWFVSKLNPPHTSYTRIQLFQETKFREVFKQYCPFFISFPFMLARGFFCTRYVLVIDSPLLPWVLLVQVLLHTQCGHRSEVTHFTFELLQLLFLGVANSRHWLWNFFKLLLPGLNLHEKNLVDSSFFSGFWQILLTSSSYCLAASIAIATSFSQTLKFRFRWESFKPASCFGFVIFCFVLDSGRKFGAQSKTFQV